MIDLFSYAPPPRYPEAPGFKDWDTSRKAADALAGRHVTLQDRCLKLVARAGPRGLTADEAAELTGETVLSIRPRFTELLALRRIRDSGQRRRNSSGRSAKVWVAA